MKEYNKDLAKTRFNDFIKKWCGGDADYRPHLLDNDENDGQYFREFLDTILDAAYKAGIEEAVKCIETTEITAPAHADKDVMDIFAKFLLTVKEKQIKALKEALK